MEWFYALNGKQEGPVTELELTQLLRNGVITPATLVWHAGMADWKPYSSVIGMPPVPPVPSAYPSPNPAPYPASFAATPRFEYAGFWIRFLAYLIDGIVIGAIRSIVLLPLGLSMIEDHPFRSPAWFITHVGEAGFSSFVITVAYFVFFWTQYGATPGKMALKLKVVTPEGNPITLGQAIGRYFAQILSGIILGIGFMMAGWDEEKRSLHDRLAETRVIRVSRSF